MLNVKNNGVEKVLFWQQSNEAQVQEQAEFPR